MQICRGLRVNGRLETLVLADNGIDAVSDMYIFIYMYMHVYD
jgi:hypothetical protein